ncbi:MAG: TonB-dependent receptor plug domain-containing protein [Bacteroidales bacterium]|jgi:TonB-dependent SusC/RagA subfamily outer membrane receptor|nr:TonB-dependent receptor plug domain-containing protein [Bacteroidales bacterium]
MVNKFSFKRRLCVVVALFLLYGIAASAQVISGQVSETTGEGIPGATIMLKGTGGGTVTDVEGVYSLSIQNSATDIIVVSFIGMEQQEVAVDGRTQIDVTLQDGVNQLNEVVAIGYGTVRKRDITGSVASVKGADLKQIPVASVAEAMAGKMAGVQITSTEGSPDAEVNIRIRGGGSITQDNSPLIIIDGFPVASLNDISPSDIENIDVLKDASSTAIYGSRGANGVIIVTTKSGADGKVKVSYNAFYGVKKRVQKYDVLEVDD